MYSGVKRLFIHYISQEKALLRLFLYHRELGAVVFENGLEASVPGILHGVEVLVSLIDILGGLDLGYGDIGTVVADTLAVGQ